MPRAAEREPARLGRIVVAIILVVAAAVIASPTIRERSRRTFMMLAPPGTDLHGLTIHSKVLAGGIEVGRVRRISPTVDGVPLDEDQAGPGVQDGRDDALTETLIELEIDRSVRPYPGANALIDRGMVSGLSVISITSLGDRTPGARPLADGQRIGLLPPEDDLRDLLKQPFSFSLDWFAPDPDGKESRLDSLWEDVQSAYRDVRETWPALEARIDALADRYGRLGPCLREVLDGIEEVEAALTLADRENEPLLAGIEADFAEVGTRFEAAGTRADRAFASVAENFRRESELLLSGLHALTRRVASLDLTRNWQELAADFGLIAGEIARLFREIVWTLLTTAGSPGPADRMRERFDDLGRDLIGAMEEVRAAEAWLRSLSEAGTLSGEPSPAVLEAIRRIEEFANEARRLERAFRGLRLPDAVPDRLAP